MTSRDPSIDGRLLKAFALPPGPLADPLTLYRAGNSGVYHTDPSCKGGRRTRRFLSAAKERHTLIPAERGPIYLATCCKSPATFAATGYTVRLRNANSWLSAAQRLLALTPSVTAAAKARAHARQMPPHATNQACDPLGDRLVAIRDDLLAFADTEPDRYVAAAAWAMTGVADIARSPLATLLGQPAMNAILNAAATTVATGGEPSQAIVDALGTVPDPATVTIGQLPARCRFSPAAFTHPGDWAVAEWTAATTDELARFPALWSQWLTSLARTFAANRELVLAVVNLNDAPEVLREVTVACFTTQHAGVPGETIIVVPPSLLANWEAIKPVRYRSRVLPGTDAASALKIYVTLREDTHGSRPVVTLLDTAVNLVLPAA